MGQRSEYDQGHASCRGSRGGRWGVERESIEDNGQTVTETASSWLCLKRGHLFLRKTLKFQVWTCWNWGPWIATLGKCHKHCFCHSPSCHHPQGCFYKPQELNRCMSSEKIPSIPPQGRNAPCLKIPLTLWSGKRDPVMENWSTVLGTTKAKEPQGAAVLLPRKMLIWMGPIYRAPIRPMHSRWWLLSASPPW